VTAEITALLLAATKKASSSSSATFIVFLLLIAVVGYFLLIRPQKQRQRRQREQQSNIGVGDEVVTVGGIRGRVVAMDAEHVTVVTGEDTVGFAAADSQPHRIVLVRNAIARKIEPRVDPMPGETDASEDEESSADPSGNGYGEIDFGDDRVADNGHDAASAEGASAESEGTSP
jgi:preprotein translocase subunit YajC